MKNNIVFWIVMVFGLLFYNCRNSNSGGFKHLNEKTAFQTSQKWKPEIDTRGDIAIIYGVVDYPDLTFEERVASWTEKGYITHFMIGIAWGRYYDYFIGEWDGETHWDEGQMNVHGDILWHNKDTIPYIVPVNSYIEYFKERIIKRVIDAGLTSLYLEEPEFWANAGYSESFKREWESYYGFPWRPQHESAENTYLSNKLKYHLYYRAIDEVSRFAKDYGKSKGLEIKVYIPTHSLVNYSSWEIVSPEASLASLPGIDGYIAQVWTGTSREPTYFNGHKKERVFENAFLEYGSMESMTAPTGRKMFFLTDPIEDWPRDWADYKKNYEATFAAQLLYPAIDNYEIMPWPRRIYTRKFKLANGQEEALIPRFYSTQMQVMINSLNHIEVTDNQVNGSQGIGVLMSNSLMFQRFPVFEASNDPQFSEFYGLTLPLLIRGVPIKTVHMENLGYPESLMDIKLLVMTYANMKPMNENEHLHLTNWVKSGGALIYCGRDDDPFQLVEEWWNQNGTTEKIPLDHLLEKLAVTKNEAKEGIKVGKGYFHIIENNPSEFVLHEQADTSYIDKISSVYEEFGGTGTLQFKNNYLLERGNYLVAAVMEENPDTASLLLEGLYVDLFDPEIPVITQKTIKPGTQAFLYNLEKISDLSPKVIASASRVYNEEFKYRKYSFVCKAPINTTNVLRILLPNEPKSVKLILNNKQVDIFENQWDENSSTLFLKFENNPDGVEVQIKL